MQDRQELRQHIARLLEQRTASIANDAVALFPFAGVQAEHSDIAVRLGELVLRVLATSIGDRAVEPRSPLITDMRRFVLEQKLPVRHLFTLVYLLERATLDELALDESFGATSEPWPSIAQLVRHASFDVLGALGERLANEGGAHALADPLTTLHTRAVLMAVLEKEIERSERFSHPFALIVFDIDRLAEINAAHGYDFGDRVLERVGIVIRNFFRETDWVARSSGDSFGVLLPETVREHAVQLAERVRSTVQERLSLPDYRTDAQVPLTVSVAVVIAEAVDGTVTAEQLIKEAAQAVHRAKHGGRNRVERVEINVRAVTPPPRGAQLG